MTEGTTTATEDNTTTIPGEALLEVLDKKGGRLRIRMTLEEEEPRDLVFRKPTDKDWFHIVGGLPVDMVVKPKKPGGLPQVKFDTEKPGHLPAVMDFADNTVKRCAIAPKWIDESPAELEDDGPIPIEEVPSAVRIALGHLLIDLSGLKQREEDLGKS